MKHFEILEHTAEMKLKLTGSTHEAHINQQEDGSLEAQIIFDI